MSIFRELKRYYDPVANTTTVAGVMSDAVDRFLERDAIDKLSDEIVKMLATAYVEKHGDEILKHIHEKTIDAKLIQKVVANLREELKK